MVLLDIRSARRAVDRGCRESHICPILANAGYIQCSVAHSGPPCALRRTTEPSKTTKILQTPKMWKTCQEGASKTKVMTADLSRLTPQCAQ